MVRELKPTTLCFQLNQIPEPYNFSGVELFNLEKVVREVPYAEQENFYFGFDALVCYSK